MTEDNRRELIYKELSFNVVGALFEVYNSLGFGYPEKIYQRAVAEELKKSGLSFVRESFSRKFFSSSL
jgi:GxxExxY protein